MSLPTPPGTSHKSKENRRLTFTEPGPSRVVWAETNKIYPITETPSRRTPIPRSASKNGPGKSILKRTTWDELPPIEVEREITPEPSDPLVDLNYLANSVAKIVSVESSLRDLIEGYNVLAARLRACVTGTTDADASWPLFQPLRKHRELVVESMVRDLGRALEDPKATLKLAPEHDTENIDPELLSSCLPSPKPSPGSKKRKGLSEEEVKHARDLCTVCQSVLKLLSAVFTMAPLYRVFTDEQLGFLLTNVLAIPLANELPTPNARKTYALAIWLLQIQRLPAEVLEPAKDRIAYALRRGIEGELGKEGKKGSASDGLRAVHDLSLWYPTLFVPAFAPFLSSILNNLLAPTLVLRTQACHALGGFAYALASLPTGAIHTRVARITAKYLTKTPLGTPSKKPDSPTKDPLIIRTLRTTLAAVDPKHVAQGPIWALSVLANFIVLLGPTLYLEEKLTKCISALFAHAMRHTKGSVRGLGCLAWRAMTWAYFRPPPIKINDEDSDDEDGMVAEGSEWTRRDEALYQRRMDEGWSVLETVVDIGAGVATIGAALANTPDTPEDSEFVLRRVFEVLKTMAKKGGITTSDANEVLCRLVNPAQETEWDPSKLLPISLYSANPGLLTSDYKQLGQAVKPILDECPLIEDIRCLTRDELTQEWMFGAVMELWKDTLVPLKLAWGSEFPPEVLAIWSGLLRAHVATLQDTYDTTSIISLADCAVDILNAILKSKKLDLSIKVDDTLESPASDGYPGTPSGCPALAPHRWRPALKLLLVRELWNAMREVFPPSTIDQAATKVLAMLVEKEAELVVETRVADEVRVQWTLLCSEVAYFCDVKTLKAFWDPRRTARNWPESVRNCVWSNFLFMWRDENASLESSVVLLGVPFIDVYSWDMTNEDLDEWDALLRLTMDRALDGGEGIDSVAVIDRVAAAISSRNCPTSLSSTRVADLLLSHLDFSEARSAPSELFEFVNDTLISSYPPEPRNKVPCTWLLRTLTRAMDACPGELQEELFETVQGGVSLWVSDQYFALDRKEYELDVLPMYETIVAHMMSFKPSLETLDKYAPVVESAFCGRKDKPEGLKAAFAEFWKAYADVPEPARGWPEPIIKSLIAANLIELDSDEVEDTEEVEAQIMVIPSSDCFSPEIPSPRTIARLSNPLTSGYRSPVHAPSSPIASILELPRTPPSSPHPVLPHRPHKHSSPFTHLSFSLSSPAASPPSTPIRAPTSPRRRHGTVKRQSSPRRADKENTSPLRSIIPVNERIAVQSSGAVLGKRPLDVDDDDEVPDRVGKRSRNDHSYIFGEAFRPDPQSLPARAVFADISVASEAAPTPATPAKLPSLISLITAIDEPTSPSPESRPKKRKGLFLDAVEVPTWRSVKRRMSMEKEVLHERASALRATKSLPVPSKTGKLHKAQSEAELEEQYEKVYSRRTVSLTHRRRHGRESDSEVDDIESEDENDRSYSSVLKDLRGMPAFNSDDSVIMPTPALSHCSSASSFNLSDPPSSDDDPTRFIGQVTPHHLVSPAIRRVMSLGDAYELGKEPGSDDSNMSASPTRDHVARMSSVKRGSSSQIRDTSFVRSPMAALELPRPY